MTWKDLKDGHCPICDGNADVRPDTESTFKNVDCLRCGQFNISVGAYNQILKSNEAARIAYDRARWSYFLSHKKHHLIDFNMDFIRDNDATATLPSPEEQIERFIMIFFETALHISQMIRVPNAKLFNECGLVDLNSIEYIMNYYQEKGLVANVGKSADYSALRLTPAGWAHCKSILNQGSQSNSIFMAMKFGTPEFEDAYRDVFKPAAKSVGFDLFRNDEVPSPGIIDHHLRNNIRRSIMLFAELSEKNNGAYWEAGYAEGLGRPVLYFCREDIWKSVKSHFDTNHCTTVIWSRDGDTKCYESIREILKNAFPDRATIDSGI